MKKNYLSIFILLMLVAPFASSAQQRSADWCISEKVFQEKAKHDPSLLQNREALERETSQYIADRANHRSSGVVRIIPVVFHIIHECGPENISDAQCLDQIEVLNLDYRRLNADTTDIPSVFKPLAGDCEVEFRIAQKDPNGNPTNGITRTFSHLTNDARDNVKALAYWPSNQYLNIWVVKSITDITGTLAPGLIIAGFAQFPGGAAATDGVEIRSNFVGRIGTAASSGDQGRTTTHEVGHWLNLRHIWGDATCGSDLVSDTPTQNVNQSTCPAWPKIDAACGNAPNGAMFTDYMDYSSCTNMFSAGQCARMNAALSSATSGRNNLWSSANLIATGTDGSAPQVGIPQADFCKFERQFICEGASVDFADISWNATPTSWNWSFPGGTPSTSTDQNPTVQYNTPGVYDVTLNAATSAGGTSKTFTGMINVSPAAATNNTYPFTEGFETLTIPGNDWYVVNEAGNGWQVTGSAAHSGFSCVKLTNYPANVQTSPDVFITPSFDLTNVSATKLVFWRAFAYRSSSAEDVLKVYASTSCGEFWGSPRYTKAVPALSTAGLISSNFTPNSTQWDADTVNLASATISGQPNVRFKFEYTQDSGNNLYIDDINIDGVLGINQEFAQQVKFEVYPNPAHIKAQVKFVLKAKENVQLRIFDVTGRAVKTITEATMAPGDYTYDVDAALENGVYYVELTIGNNSSVKKLVLN